MSCQIWEPDEKQNQIKSIAFPPKQNGLDSLDVASIQRGGKETQRVIRKRQASSGLKSTSRLNLWLQLLTYGTNPKQIAWNLAKVLRELYGYRTTTQPAKACNCSTLQKIPGPPNLDQQGEGYKNIAVSKKSNLCTTCLIHGKGGQKIGKHPPGGRTKGFGRKHTFLPGKQNQGLPDETNPLLVHGIFVTPIQQDLIIAMAQRLL